MESQHKQEKRLDLIFNEARDDGVVMAYQTDIGQFA